MPEQIVVGIGADISDFTSKMSSLKSEYMATKKEIDDNKIEAPMRENDVQQSFAYMLNSVVGAESVLESIKEITTSLPQGIQESMNSLVSGMKASLTSLTGFVRTAGETAQRDFNKTGFNNSIRFSAASLMQYTRDLKAASEIVSQMSSGTREIYARNHREISSVVNPAISRMFTKGHTELPDKELAAELLRDAGDYRHISKLLEGYGLTDAKARQQVIEAAIKTSTQRANRVDVQRAFTHAGITEPDHRIFATDVVKDTYKNAYINGGRYVNEEVTPLNTRRADRGKRHDYYEGIKQEVLRGNSVAFKAAQDAGLVTLSDGRYRFIKERFAKDDMLDQFSGYVVRERKRAAQGSPQYFRDLNNPYEATSLIEKDGRRIREADRLIGLDMRPNANPYHRSGYTKRTTFQQDLNQYYEHPIVGEYDNPALSIPELINIPRMVVRNQNGRNMLTVKRLNKENGQIEYQPNLDYSWQKKGIQDNPFDEFITMGRNPILDRLIARHASEGAKFEDRTFGYGFDEKDKAKSGLPLIISMDLNEFRDKDKWGNIKFTKTGKDGSREAVFPKDAKELINGLYRGDIEPNLPVTSVDTTTGKTKTDYVPYRAFAGKTTGGGTMMFMPSADYRGMIAEDKKRGIMPMLQYFSEMEGSKLINPATGRPFENNETGLGAYARFYDARNKILSHSLPIEELGGKTPTSALINFGAFYDALGTPDNKRFDGGGFIDKSVYSKDFQARMGPAKFLAQRFDWRKWFQDAEFATKGGEFEGDTGYHFFMPGMSATADDYKAYRAAVKAGLSSDARSVTYEDRDNEGKKISRTFDFDGKTFKEWRDDMFVDVMDQKYGALLADTTIKAPGMKKGRITEEQFNEIVKAVEDKPNSAFHQKKILDRSTVGKEGVSPMVRLTTAQQTELMKMMSDPEIGLGLRLMKDTENYAGDKQFWSPAYMSSVMMTPAMMRRSSENYIKAFKQMSTDEGIIERMFSGNDIDSVRVRENNLLLYTDPRIKARVAAEKQNLVQKQLLGYGYFPESTGMKSQMLVATPNPYSVFNPIGNDITGHDAAGQAGLLKTGRHQVVAATVGTDGIVNWTRSPYAPGANFFGKPVRKGVTSQYGLTKDSAMFNIEDFYDLNTGDFDGDFVWANTALKDDKEFQARTERRNQKVIEIANRRLAERKAMLKSQGKTDDEIEADALQFAGITDRAFNASMGPTGLGYKIGQAFRMGLFSEKDLAEIDDYANDTYQKGIDMAKKVDVRLSSPTEAVQEAIGTRKPIERLTKDLQAATEGGEKLGSVDLFKYGLPTYVDQIGTGILNSAKAINGMDVGALDFIAEQIEANNKVRYADATPEEQKLANWYGDLVAGKLTGRYQITTTEQLTEGRGLLNQLQSKMLEYKQKNINPEAVARMQEMEIGARNAINTESLLGYTDSNLNAISEYNMMNNWNNPVTNQEYTTKNQAAAAAVIYEQRRKEDLRKVEQLQQSEFDQLMKEQTGKNITSANRELMLERIDAAHRYTGFNWSNAKYFTEGNMTIPVVRTVSLEGTPSEYGIKVKPEETIQNDSLDPNKTVVQKVQDNNTVPVTINFDKDRDFKQAQVARRILTGTTLAEPALEAHALLGSAAHAFMDTYGRARAFRGENDRAATQEEALEQANNALLDYLLGEKNGEGKRVLTREQREAQQRAKVSFGLDEYGQIIATGQNAEKLSSKLYALNNGSLKDVASLYYERSLQNLGEHMIMSEGTSFGLDKEGNIVQEEALGKAGHNGVYYVPRRDGQNVIDFPRYVKDPKTGEIRMQDAGVYFTPDMVKQDANGGITIVDWKSSPDGQRDALFQTAYYAHNLEELGKQYYLTGNKDYEKYAKYVNYNEKTKEFTSNIKNLETVDLFGNKNNAVLQADYTMALGDAVAKWIEKGMQNEAVAARQGFINQLPNDIKPVFNRIVQGKRPTYAPETEEKEIQGVRTKDVQKYIEEDTTGALRQIQEVSSGHTGIKDREGNYIDQDKSFLVEKYKEDRETLNNIRSFNARERANLYNLDYQSKDRFTKNIEDARSVFSNEDYQTLLKYYQGNHSGDIAADVAMMETHFNAQQAEASRQMAESVQLRQKYFDLMPDQMSGDYNRIAAGQGSAISRLRSGIRKRQQDLSLIDEVYKSDDLYNAQTGRIARIMDNEEDQAKADKETVSDIFHSIYKDPERKENESKKEYNSRRKAYRDEKIKEAQAALEGHKEREAFYQGRRNLVTDSFSQFEQDMLDEIKQEAEDENILYDLLKGRNINASTRALQSKAAEYRKMGATRTSENGSYVFSDQARGIFAQRDKTLTGQAEMLESLKGNEQLTALLGAQANYDQARLNAMMTGTAISPEIIKMKQMAEFAAAYAKINPKKNMDDILAATEQYGQTYERQIGETHQTRLDNLQYQNDMAARQREYQYQRFDRNRYGNAGRFVQYYQQQQDRRFELETQKKTAEHNAANIEKQLKTETDPKKIAETKVALQGYKQAAADASNELQKFTPAQNLFAAGVKSVGDSVNMVVRRLGMQLFRKALNEAKTFVKEFNKQMTTIQMITLKSDSQMSAIGDGLIDKAKQLKISVSEISQSAATLYRQGLSDEEVNERLDVVSKFSKVSGTKIDAATKLITVAMNTGLVSDPETAADIVTALGDNAATNASEIEKGIEKAGAAAAADGTTFGQLAAMLTAITSTTQIGGNVAGRTLNTIFGRMNKIGTNELIYDENGNAISGSAVAKLLKEEGVETYINGEKRSSFDVLYELSQKWDSLSDAKQQRLASAIAGTRQYSNFSAIMQGMSEGKIDEYMSLIGESSGITDQKYQIYVESLEASLTNLKNTFDELVSDLVDSHALTGFIDTLSNIIKGVDSLSKSVGGLNGVLAAVLPMLAAITLFKAGVASGNLALIAGGLAGAFITGSTLNSLGSGSSQKEQYEKASTIANDRYSSIKSKIEEAKVLEAKGDKRTSEEDKKYKSLVSEVSSALNVPELNEFVGALDSVSSSAQSAAQSTLDYAKALKTAETENEKNRIENLKDLSGQWASTAAKEIQEYEDEQDKKGVMDSKYIEDFFVTDASGNKHVDIQHFLNTSTLGFSYDGNESAFQKNIGAALNNWDSVPVLGNFIDWAAPGIRKAVGKDKPDLMDYSWTKNRPRLAQLMMQAVSEVSSTNGELFSELQKGGYTSWGQEEWESYLGDAHAGKKVSNLPLEALDYAIQRWEKNNSIESGKREKIQSDFSAEFSEFNPELTKDQAETMAKHAADQVLNLTNNGMEMGAAYGHVLNNALKLDTTDNTPESIKSASKDYLKESGWTEKEKTEAGLEKIGVNDYFYDPVHNEYISAEEAEKRAAAVTYKGKTYTNQALAEKAKSQEQALQQQVIDSNIQKEIETLHQEQLTTVYGRKFGEEDQDALLQHLKENAMTLGTQKYGTPEYLYIDKNGLGYSEEEFRQLYENPELYQYTDRNGYTSFGQTKADLANARRIDYENIMFEGFKKAGLDTQDFWAKDIPDRLAEIYSWWQNQGGISYEDFINDNPFVQVDYNAPYRNDEEKFRLSQAKTEAQMTLLETYTKTPSYNVGTEAYYDTLEEALKSNMDQLMQETLAEYGATDISQLPTEGGVRYKWKDQWYDTYEDAVSAIDQYCKELFTFAEDAITVDENHVDASKLVVYKNKFIEALNYDGDKGWLTQNKAKVDADYITGIIQSGVYKQEGINDLVAFMHYINSNDTAQLAWQTVGANGDISRILEAAGYDPKTQTFKNPEGVLDQLLHTTQGLSLTRGAANLTTQKKAELAQEAYNGLINNGWFVSSEEMISAQDNAWLEYQKEKRVAEYTKRIADIEAVEGMPETDRIQAKTQVQREFGDVITNKEDFLASRPDLTTGFVSPEQMTYLKEALSDQMYARVIEASTGGKALTAEEKKYVGQVLQNRMYGLTSLTAGQQLEGIKDVRQAIKNKTYGTEGGYSTVLADQYMSQWSNWGEYSALLQKQADLQAKGKKLDDDDVARLKDLETSLDNFQKNAEIKYEIEGLQQLEEAGDLLEGTTATIEKLKKGGRIEIEAVVKLRQDIHSESQLAAMLSGTEEQQREAIMQLTGASEASVINNTEHWKAEAQRISSQQREERAKSLSAERDFAEDKEAFDALAEEEGYKWVSDYILPKGYTVDENGTVYKEGSSYADYDETERRESLIGKGHYEDAGVPDIDVVNPLRTEKQTFTKKESQDALNKILSGELEYSNETADLYEAGLSVAGTYTRELIKRKAKGLAISDSLQRASDNERRNEPTFTEEDYDLSTAAGALTYSRLNYEQNNKQAVAANAVYQSLTNGSIKSVADLATAVNDSDVKNWSELLSSSDDLRKQFDKLGIKIGQDGKLDFSNIEDSSEGLASALGSLAELIAGISDEHNNVKPVQSIGETYQYATSFLNGSISKADEEKGYEALAEITGNSELAQTVRNNYDKWETARTEYDEYNALNSRDKKKWRQDHDGRVPTAPEEFNPYEGLTQYNADYAALLFENAGFGISGLTDIQRFEKLQELIAAASIGSSANGIGSLREQDKIGAFADYTSGVEGADKWLSASEQLEQYGLTMAQLSGLQKGTEEYANAEKAIKGIYASVEQAAEAHDDFMDNVAQTGQQLKTNGKYMDAYNAGLKKNSKNTKEAATATTNYNKTVSDVLKRQKARTEFKNSGKISDELVQMLGKDKDEIKKDKENALKDLQVFEEADKQELASAIQGEWDAIAGDVTAQLASKGLSLGEFTSIVDGEAHLDFGKLAGQLDGQAQQGIQAIASALAGKGVTWSAVVSGDGANGSVVIVVNDLGKGSGKTGGGGGGGKSEIDKLLEKHKHKITAIEHESKMLEIKEKGYDFVNDYVSQEQTVNEEINVQEKLRSTYAENISEMEEQLAKVKEGEDDWYKLKEAIYAAEEAMASINNTINDLNGKRIEITEQKQEIEDKPTNHTLSMLSKYAERYQKMNNFETYEAVMNQTIDETKKQIEQNNKQIEEWESLLLKYKENSDDWIKTRDKIWSMREENAELENQVAADTIDLQEAKISQIARDLENQQAPLTHANTMLDTFAQMYESTRDYDQYQNALKSSIENNKNLKDMNDAAIAELKEQINALEESDPARENAIKTLYQLEEASAQYEASMLSNQQAIEESLITEMTEKYGDKDSVFEHELALLQQEEKAANRDRNYAQYQNILGEESRNIAQTLANQKDELQDLLALQNSGLITKGSQQWRSLEEEIRKVEESIASLGNEYQEALDKLNVAKFEEKQEKFNEVYELAQHTQKMIQYEETKYQTNGELTNYATALGWEHDSLLNTRDAIEAYIEELKEQQDLVKDQPDLYKRITNELYKWEEQLSQTNNAIEKNTLAQEKNQEAIRKAQIAVEQQADKAIRERIQKEKDMLNATVSIENSILSVIRKNYQDQWDLEKKTIEKKKQALQEEKNLINERLNARKNAVDEENKYEELAEYQHQLVLISADTTRTKEQAELRKKIADLQEELAWDVATEEVNATIKSIDDQIAAYDTYVNNYSEDLNEMLSDANNFREELDVLLSGSFEDFMAWNAAENEDYIKKTDEERKQMEENWHTTWRTMKDELLTYWDEVDESMRSKDSWLALVTSQNSYLKLSDKEKESYLYQMGKLYDDYEKSLINNAEFDDEHQILQTLSEMKTWTFNVRDISNRQGYNTNSQYSDSVYNRDTNLYDIEAENSYAGVGYVEPPKVTTPQVQSQNKSGGTTKKNQTYYFTTTDTRGNPTSQGGSVEASSMKEAMEKANAEAAKMGRLVDVVSDQNKNYTSEGADLSKAIKSTETLESPWKSWGEPVNDEKKKYATGGLVDYTGLAWVDGTKAKPESFLDAADTKLLRTLLDTFNYVAIPRMSNIDTAKYGNDISFGDVNVTINEAQISSNQDITDLAQRVGKAFTKQLQKDGLNLANYAW